MDASLVSTYLFHTRPERISTTKKENVLSPRVTVKVTIKLKEMKRERERERQYEMIHYVRVMQS